MSGEEEEEKMAVEWRLEERRRSSEREGEEKDELEEKE